MKKHLATFLLGILLTALPASAEWRTETFSIELDDAENATVGDGTAIVTIRDDD